MQPKMYYDCLDWGNWSSDYVTWGPVLFECWSSFSLSNVQHWPVGIDGKCELCWPVDGVCYRGRPKSKPKCPLVDQVRDDMLGTEGFKLWWRVEEWNMLSVCVCYEEMMCYLQVSDVKWLLIDVGSVCPSCQASYTGQVATVASHGLNDEHASLCPTGRLLDAVTSLTHAYKLTMSVHSRWFLHTKHYETVYLRYLQLNVMFNKCQKKIRSVMFSHIKTTVKHFSQGQHAYFSICKRVSLLHLNSSGRFMLKCCFHQLDWSPA